MTFYVRYFAPMKMKSWKDTRIGCDKRSEDWLEYLHGNTDPHFPMPAIRQSFEFGWSLSDAQPVLFHVVQGTYYDGSGQ